MKAHHFGIVLLTLLLASGCGLEGPVPSETKPAPPAPQVAQDTGGKPVAAPSHVGPAPSAATAATQPTTTPAPSPVPNISRPSAAAAAIPPGMVREQAHVGMGEKGRGYGGGLLAVTLKSYWNVKEMLALDEIKHSMDLYKATEGHYPKTQEEFMEKIIKDGHIKLPVLPPNHRYVYDPTAEEFLMIEAPEMTNDPPDKH